MTDLDHTHLSSILNSDPVDMRAENAELRAEIERLRAALHHAEQKNEQQVANCRNDRIARETAEERIRSLQNALVVAHARLARNGPTDVG